MTSRRYRSYRRARDLVAAIGPEWLPDPAREILDDLIEHMLLNRASDTVEVRHLREDAVTSVRELSAAGMVPPAVVEELVDLVLAAAPAPPTNRKVAHG